jgi:hypothetical protein
MHGFIFYAGAISGTLAALVLVWRLGYAMVASLSLIRCTLASRRMHHRPVRWGKILTGFFRRLWTFWWSPKNTVMIRGHHFTWRGVGDWTVYPSVSHDDISDRPEVTATEDAEDTEEMEKSRSR